MVAELDSAQRVLLAAVPTARSEAVPLEDAAAEFLAALERVDALMPAWRTAATETNWLRCADAIGEARGELDLVLAEGALGFEGLINRLGDVIAPLEEFAEAAEVVRRV